MWEQPWSLTEFGRDQPKKNLINSNSIPVFKLFNIFFHIMCFLVSNPLLAFSTLLGVLNPGSRWRIVLLPFSIEWHPHPHIWNDNPDFAEAVCVCMYLLLFIFFSCAFWTFGAAWWLSRKKPKKCKSLRIKSDMFTLLFQLEGWSYRRASGCVK